MLRHAEHSWKRDMLVRGERAVAEDRSRHLARPGRRRDDGRFQAQRGERDARLRTAIHTNP